MAVFSFGDFIFKKENENLGCCIVGTDNEVLGNGAVLGVSFSGPAVIPSYAKDSAGNRFRVIKIGKYSFRECLSLKFVSLPQTLEIIGWDAFYQTSIEHVVVPRNVEILERNAFSCMEKLKLVVFEQGSRLREMGLRIFVNCKELQSITFPPSLSIIGEGIFHSAVNLESVSYCSNINANNIVTPFYGILHTVTVYVTSEYPQGAKFGGSVVTVSDEHCAYYSGIIMTDATHKICFCSIIGQHFLMLLPAFLSK